MLLDIKLEGSAKIPLEPVKASFPTDACGRESGAVREAEARECADLLKIFDRPCGLGFHEQFCQHEGRPRALEVAFGRRKIQDRFPFVSRGGVVPFAPGNASAEVTRELFREAAVGER